jgi:hypothetical protein
MIVGERAGPNNRIVVEIKIQKVKKKRVKGQKEEEKKKDAKPRISHKS